MGGETGFVGRSSNAPVTDCACLDELVAKGRLLESSDSSMGSCTRSKRIWISRSSINIGHFESTLALVISSWRRSLEVSTGEYVF